MPNSIVGFIPPPPPPPIIIAPSGIVQVFVLEVNQDTNVTTYKSNVPVSIDNGSWSAAGWTNETDQSITFYPPVSTTKYKIIAGDNIFDTKAQADILVSQEDTKETVIIKVIKLVNHSCALTIKVKDISTSALISGANVKVVNIVPPGSNSSDTTYYSNSTTVPNHDALITIAQIIDNTVKVEQPSYYSISQTVNVGSNQAQTITVYLKKK